MRSTSTVAASTWPRNPLNSRKRLFYHRRPPRTRKMFLDLNRNSAVAAATKMFLELSCDGMRLCAYLEVGELWPHIEGHDMLRQALSNEIYPSRSVAKEALRSIKMPN